MGILFLSSRTFNSFYQTQRKFAWKQVPRMLFKEILQVYWNQNLYGIVKS